MLTKGDTKVLPKDAIKAVPSASEIAASREYSITIVGLRVRGPATIVLDAEKLWQYSASEIRQILNGELPLPKGW